MVITCLSRSQGDAPTHVCFLFSGWKVFLISFLGLIGSLVIIFIVPILTDCVSPDLYGKGNGFIVSTYLAGFATASALIGKLSFLRVFSLFPPFFKQICMPLLVWFPAASLEKETFSFHCIYFHFQEKWVSAKVLTLEFCNFSPQLNWLRQPLDCLSGQDVWKDCGARKNIQSRRQNSDWFWHVENKNIFCACNEWSLGHGRRTVRFVCQQWNIFFTEFLSWVVFFFSFFNWEDSVWGRCNFTSPSLPVTPLALTTRHPKLRFDLWFCVNGDTDPLQCFWHCQFWSPKNKRGANKRKEIVWKPFLLLLLS